MSVVVYVIIFGAFALWAARDAKKRIAAGAKPRDVGGGPVSVFFVVLVMPVIGGLFYLYKRNKDYTRLPK
jgi:cytosine/uracil/thiamine/allantoin permease